jgi:hypothetical protein
MRISTIPNMPDDFELILFGDNQDGNIATAHDKYQECIEYILAAENRYAVHMGDIMDAFWCDDHKRYDPTTCKITPAEQKKNVVKDLTALAKTGRLITILKGNHERALELKYGDITTEICEALQVVSGTQYPISGTYTHKLEFMSKDNGLMFKGYFTHGRKSLSSVSPDPHRRRAYIQFRLKRLLENMAGDCILMARGHSHIVLVTPPIPTLYLTSEKGKLKQHYTHPGTGKSGAYIPPEHRWYGCTGSFLRSFALDVETYSELAEYEPIELGYLKAVVHYDYKNGITMDLQEIKV